MLPFDCHIMVLWPKTAYSKIIFWETSSESFYVHDNIIIPFVLHKRTQRERERKRESERERERERVLEILMEL